MPEKYKSHYHSEEDFKDGMILDRRGMAFFNGGSSRTTHCSEV
jgi:hypothetical protein